MTLEVYYTVLEAVRSKTLAIKAKGNFEDDDCEHLVHMRQLIMPDYYSLDLKHRPRHQKLKI